MVFRSRAFIEGWSCLLNLGAHSASLSRRLVDAAHVDSEAIKRPEMDALARIKLVVDLVDLVRIMRTSLRQQPETEAIF